MDSPLSEQNLPWREKVLVTGPDVMFEVSWLCTCNMSRSRSLQGVRDCVFFECLNPSPAEQNNVFAAGFAPKWKFRSATHVWF